MEAIRKNKQQKATKELVSNDIKTENVKNRYGDRPSNKR